MGEEGVARRPIYWVPLLALTLSGFALRIYESGSQSIWADELFSFLYTRMSPFEIVRTVITWGDPQTPLYYLLLKSWLLIAGQSEFSVRFISVFFGTLSVAAVARLGALLGRRQAGLLAAAFFAVSAYQVWYSQEARTYTLTTALCLLSLLFFVRLLKPGRSFWLYFGLVASTTIAIYSHYYALLVLGAENVLFLLLFRPQRLPVRPWIGAQMALALPYLPWVGQALRLFISHRGEGELVSQALLVDIFREYSLAWFLPQETTDWLLLGFAALSLIGLLDLAFPFSRKRLAAFLVPVLYILVPLLGSLAFVVVTRRPLFGGRYLMLVMPAYALLLGVGAIRLGRITWPLGFLAIAFVMGSNLFSLANYYDNPRFARPDYRSLTAYLEANQQPGDVIVAMSDTVVQALDIYYHGGLPVAVLTYRIPQSQYGDELAKLGQTYRRLWLIPYGATEGDQAAVDWLNRNTFLITSRWFTQTQLRLYAPVRQGLQPLPAQTQSFEQGVNLVAARVGPRPVAAGETLELELELLVPKELPAGYNLAVRLTDRAGHLILHAEQALSEGEIAPGGRVRLRRALAVPADSLPGEYPLLVGFYRDHDGKRLAVLNRLGAPQGIWANPGEVTIARPEVSAGGPARAGGLVRFGDQLELREASLSSSRVSPGDKLVIALSWGALTQPRSDLIVGAEVADSSGQAVARVVGSLANAVYPSSRWPAGTVVRDYLDVPMPGRVPGGVYQVRLFVQDQGTRLATAGGDFWTVGKIEVGDRPRIFTPPDVRYRLPCQFGDGVELLGYDLAGEPVRPGGKVQVTLYWRARGEVARNYNVFAHLLDAETRVVAQHDGPPAAGTALTNSWVEGEVIEDAHEIAIPPDLPPGEYRLEVGLYEMGTDERLKIEGGEAKVGDDSLILPNLVRVAR